MTTEIAAMDLAQQTPVPKGRIGRFVYESEIGQGSVGVVYLFRDPLIGRKVAIKILNSQLPANRRQLFEKHFIQEARAAGRLNHPNIVTVYDADKENNLLYIVMEYLEGKELRDMLASGHRFTYKQIADLMARTANALDYAHEHGVIHRDIKPANIFITNNHIPKVLDFGIASASRQLSDADATLGHDELSEQRLLGTPNYMSPEQTRGDTIDARTDIFSLGVVLYQLLCGELPFKGDSIKKLMNAIAHDPAIPPQEIRPDVPLRLARIAAKAIAKKPEDRYARASDMAHDLNRFLSKERAERMMAQIQQPGKHSSTDKQTAYLEIRAKGDRRRKSDIKNPNITITIIAVAAILLTTLAGWVWIKPTFLQSTTASQLISNTNLNKPTVASINSKTPVTAKEALNSDSEEIIDLPVANKVPSTINARTSVVSNNDQNALPNKKLDSATKAVTKNKISNTALPTPSLPTTIGLVQFAVSPWGEVFVDGQAKGVTPPLARLNLSTGKHKIEIRNGDDSYSVNIEVNADKENKVGHHF